MFLFIYCKIVSSRIGFLSKWYSSFAKCQQICNCLYNYCWFGISAVGLLVNVAWKCIYCTTCVYQWMYRPIRSLVTNLCLLLILYICLHLDCLSHIIVLLRNPVNNHWGYCDWPIKLNIRVERSIKWFVWNATRLVDQSN